MFNGRLTLTIFPFMERVASRKRRWLIKKLYLSSLSRIGPAVYIGDVGKL